MLTTRSLIIPIALTAMALTACAGSEAEPLDDEPGVILDQADVAEAPVTLAPEPIASEPATTEFEPSAETADESTAPEVAITVAPAEVPASDPAPESVPVATEAPAPAAEPLPVVASRQVDDTTFEGETVPLVVDVNRLSRSNGRVLLEFSVTNTSDSVTWTVLDDFAEGAVGDFTASGVSLIDLANDLRYLVLVDSEGDCICSEVGGADVAPGQSVSYSASFPAPPADVTLVDVQLGGVVVIADVTIADR